MTKDQPTMVECVARAIQDATYPSYWINYTGQVDDAPTYTLTVEGLDGPLTFSSRGDASDFVQQRIFACRATAAIKAMSDAEPVASHEVDETGKPTDDSDPWFQLGWHKVRLACAESELETWKERAMSLRVSAPQPHTAPIPHEQGRDEVERLREALQCCADAPLSGWTIAQAVARAALSPPLS